MNKKISCFDCKHYEEYDVNDWETSCHCSHDISNKLDETDGDVHPIKKCTMFEPKETE